MLFKDRNDAGKQLARRLKQYATTNSIVLAIPRGGVVIGYEVAQRLKLPLDVVVTRKVGHPNNPEFALCAVTADGDLLCDETISSVIQSDEVLSTEIKRERKEAVRRTELYRKGRKVLVVAHRTVLLVDDGIATGLTMRLALKCIRALNPSGIVIAAPVVAPDVRATLKKEGAQSVVSLTSPKSFLGAIGGHYSSFEQIDDDTVIKYLAECRVP